MIKNTHIKEVIPVISPADLLIKYDTNDEDKKFVVASRSAVQNIVGLVDKRLLVIVGPCSIHDYDGALEYAKQLQKIQAPNLFIVMRVYFEKPRSRLGWKGFIYDPDLDNSCDINKGLDLARKLLLELTKMRIPVGCEFLDLISPQYLSDLVSWGAIGARTSESQIHRQLASGLSMPVGFKNLTNGDYEKAIDGIISAGCSHSFLGIDEFGKASHISTTGNIHAHLILRGGLETNYQEQNIIAVTEALKKENHANGFIIDCSHGNSRSHYIRQILVAIYIKRLRMLNKYPVVGLMLESNIIKGKQKISDSMTKGQSITDACIDIGTTRELLALLNSEKYNDYNSLGEIRKAMRSYDTEISKHQITEGFLPDPALVRSFVKTDYIFEQDETIAELCAGHFNEERLVILISCRLALSEKVAHIKYKANPFNYLYNHNDLLKLITDREIEKANLRLFPNRVYLRIMEISKEIQVQYLEKVTHHIRIGYLFGKGTFSGEVISKNFRGTHIYYDTYELLKTALENKAVDYILIPTYNSLIGEIIKPETYWDVYGTVDHRIDLCLYSNTKIELSKTKKYEPDVLYLETHVQKEAENYLYRYFGKKTEVVIVNTSKTGCINCIKDIGKRVSMTISSKNNNSNFLTLIDSDIVDHNITTFSLISI